MVFNSVTFLIFLSTFVTAYWLLPDRPRRALIFLGSLTFYGFWRIDFLVVLLLSCAVDFIAARRIEAADNQRQRCLWLAGSLCVNLGLLVFFKYAYFLADNANSIAGLFGMGEITITWQIPLLLGISFYTFQSISYTIDVYRGLIKAERRFIPFANYVIFFPQLVAGPILRYREVAPQLKDRPPFQPDELAEGIKRVLIGLFLKVCCADVIAPFVDAGYAVPASSLSPIDVVVLACLFGFQIYFDFAAYSHIAIGTAGMMGIRFVENFNWPYHATSPRQFWQRWHISLSSWIRDYVYLPLTGGRFVDRSTGGIGEVLRDDAKESLAVVASSFDRAKALVLTWLLMGLWHGANWTFVLWGAWHAMTILLWRLLRLPEQPKGFALPLCWMLTFGAAMIGWLPFRAASLGDALTMLTTLFWPGAWVSALTGQSALLALPRESYWVFILVLPVMLLAKPAWGLAKNISAKLPMGYALIEFIALVGLMIMVFLYLRPLDLFIYFQF
ncbi:MAG: MBOAT family O-acyltransferase [Magnetovibrionaceae bacterium]